MNALAEVRGTLAWLVFLSVWVTVGCTSVNIIVGEDAITVANEQLSACGGTQFKCKSSP